MLLLLAFAFATDYYVNSSVTNPFSTVITSNLKPGDRVIFRAGTYSTYSGTSWYRYYNFSGTAQNPIIIESYPGEKVIIQGDSGYSQNIVNVAGSWYIIRNIEFQYGSHGVRLHSSVGGVLENLIVLYSGDVAVSMNVFLSLRVITERSRFQEQPTIKWWSETASSRTPEALAAQQEKECTSAATKKAASSPTQ
jgi:hypothetical protein